MSSEDDRMPAVLALIKALNEGDLEGVRELLSEQCVLRIPASGTELVGRDSFTRRAHPRPATWSQVEIQVIDAVHAPQQVAVEALVTGTHTGDWATGIPEIGQVAATLRRVTRPACYLVRFEGGRVARFTSYYDRMALVQQLLH